MKDFWNLPAVCCLRQLLNRWKDYNKQNAEMGAILSLKDEQIVKK